MQGHLWAQGHLADAGCLSVAGPLCTIRCPHPFRPHHPYHLHCFIGLLNSPSLSGHRAEQGPPSSHTLSRPALLYLRPCPPHSPSQIFGGVCGHFVRWLGPMGRTQQDSSRRIGPRGYPQCPHSMTCFWPSSVPQCQVPSTVSYAALSRNASLCLLPLTYLRS